MLSITLIYSIITILGVGSILNPILIKCNVTAASTGPSVSEADQAPSSEPGDQSEGKENVAKALKDLFSILIKCTFHQYLSDHRLSLILLINRLSRIPLSV